MILALQENSDFYKQEINLLREQIRLLRQKLFGRKSEKLDISPEEMRLLFPEWAEEQPPVETKTEEIKVEAHSRAKTGRKPIPDDLERVAMHHDLSEEEKICGCGATLSPMGTEQSEELDYVPAQYRVLVHIRHKYTCKSCQGVDSEGPTVKIAPPPAKILPKSMASSDLLAHIFVSKFCDALPFYRQSGMFARDGIEISRASMCNWAIGVWERCQPLMEVLIREMRTGPVVYLDETTIQVLDEEGAQKPEKGKGKSKSYMWLGRGGPPDKPAIYFHYDPSRSGDIAKALLSDYRGAVQTDGYAGYNFLDKNPGIIHVGCWAHVRRKFVETIQSAGGKHGNGLADQAVSMIRELYKVEKEIESAQLVGDAIVAVRKEKAEPMVKQIKAWLDENVIKTPPKSLLGKAMRYALKEWPKLIVYLKDPDLRPDNNLAENAIRPFVVGRKNWLFSKSPEGARTCAFFYSLIETAKLNGIEPYSYLCALFKKYPLANNPEEIKSLLPQHIDRSVVKPYTPQPRKKKR